MKPATNLITEEELLEAAEVEDECVEMDEEAAVSSLKYWQRSWQALWKEALDLSDAMKYLWKESQMPL